MFQSAWPFSPHQKLDGILDSTITDALGIQFRL